MNRMEEYNALMQELEETPVRLNFTVARAKARTRRQRVRKWVGAPLISLSAACCAFVLLVNVSTPFAMACAKVPFFKELAEAVCFNPSLTAAVENEWVQPIGQTDSDNGYSMTVEYVIIDQKQLNIFYSLASEVETDPKDFYMVYSDLWDEQGEALKCAVIAGSSFIDGELYQITADFTSQEGTMPDRIHLECELYFDEGERTQREAVAQFGFDLSFDPKFTQEAKVIAVEKWLELDGQKILLKNVEIYPTHMRINLEDDPDNTAWLRELELYVEDETGTRYEAGSNNITSTGSPDSPFTRSFRVESTFFSESKHLTLCIAGAKWLDKEQQWTWVNTATGETGFLPEGVTLREYSRTGDTAKLIFRVYVGEDQPYGSPVMDWRNPGGEEQSFGRYGVTTAVDYESDTGPGTVAEGYCDVHLTLEPLSGDIAELELKYTEYTEREEAIKIPLS